MVDAAMRRQILERFTSIVRPLLAAAQSLEIVRFPQLGHGGRLRGTAGA
jgi:hypothetical protein